MPEYYRVDTLGDLSEMFKSLSVKKDLWNNLAAAYKNAFDALVRAGFTPDQAMTILSQQGIGIKLS